MNSSRAARFKRADIERAIKGAAAAGLRIGRVEIEPNGKILIVPASESGAGANSNSWDRVLR